MINKKVLVIIICFIPGINVGSGLLLSVLVSLSSELVLEYPIVLVSLPLGVAELVSSFYIIVNVLIILSFIVDVDIIILSSWLQFL